MDCILSICIPTYNRRIWLERCLGSLFSHLTNKIEILISDNCSTDDTQYYCEKIEKAYPIKYHRQETNIGPDGNFLWLLNNSSGKYTMILADDDYIEEGSLEKILDYLGKSDLAFALINSGSIKDGEIFKNRIYKREGQIFYEEKDLDKMLIEAGVQLTFVSAMIFNTQYVKNIENKEKYLSTNLLQSHLLLKSLASSKQTAIFRDAYIIAEHNNSGGYNIYNVFVNKWYDVLFKTGISVGIKKNVIVTIFNNTIRSFILSFLLKEKMDGKLPFATDHKWKNLNKCLRFKNGWTKILPTLILPKFILKKVVRGE